MVHIANNFHNSSSSLSKKNPKLKPIPTWEEYNLTQTNSSDSDSLDGLLVKVESALPPKNVNQATNNNTDVLEQVTVVDYAKKVLQGCNHMDNNEKEIKNLKRKIDDSADIKLVKGAPEDIPELKRTCKCNK